MGIDQRLIWNVHPPDWRNPPPAKRYHLAVVGAGSAGLVCAAAAAALGARVALIERNLMGGECLNFGCVPSKTLLRAARACADATRMSEYGISRSADAGIDFATTMERVRRIRAKLSEKDSASRFRSLGVDLFFGEAHFSGPASIDLMGETLRFKRAVIATGSRAASLPVEGLTQTGFLTNESVFSLTTLPRRLVVVGAGPIGCELAQAFSRFGSRVTLLEAEPSILPREDTDAARMVRKILVQEGIEIIENCHLQRVRRSAGEKCADVSADGGCRQIVFDQILLAVGRIPTVEKLGLEAAGVKYDRHQGVVTDNRLRTSNHRIFAAGDVCSAYKFTHLADAMARIVIRNALFFGREKLNHLTIPSCIYTDPEVAHVGLYEHEALARGIPVQTFFHPLGDVDRAVIDGEAEGFLKLHVRRGTDRIVGATLVAKHAGEIISELALAIDAGIGLKSISRTIHPYPTYAEVIRKIADSYNRTRLTPRARWLLAKWFAWAC
jgi:pyruvate/2-oxoglutarate dehydrogenase complex dihydrolipoamide dehydrogenase (E3) component